MDKKEKILMDNKVDTVRYLEYKNHLLSNIFTTCLLINSETKKIVGRGISICSLKDSFNRSKGKNQAFGRAIIALKSKQNSLKIKGKARKTESVIRKIKIKCEDDEIFFTKFISKDLIQLNPQLQIKVSKHKSFKEYIFKLPISYPIQVANNFFKYKSSYLPVPVENELKVLENLE